MKLLTTLVKSAGQLEVGEFYLIRGEHRGLPLPPQVFHLKAKNVHTVGLGNPYIEGDLYWNMLGIKHCSRNHRIFLHEVGIPDLGQHDHHLERVGAQGVNRVMEDESWTEISKDKMRIYRERKVPPPPTPFSI